MSNDAVVRPLSFDSSPGVPYAVYLERAIAQALPKTLLPRAPARLLSWEQVLTTTAPTMCPLRRAAIWSGAMYVCQAH